MEDCERIRAKELHSSCVLLLFMIAVLLPGCRDKTVPSQTPVVSGQTPAAKDASVEPTVIAREDNTEDSPYKWDLLFISPEDVLKIELIISDDDANFWSAYSGVPVTSLAMSITDEATISEALFCLFPGEVLCTAAPKGRRQQLAARSHGQIVIATSSTRTSIWLSDVGLSIEETPTWHSRFFSAGFMQVMERAIAAQGRTALPMKMVECFTGINVIRTWEASLRQRTHD